LTFLRKAHQTYSQQSDQLAASMDTIRQEMQSAQDGLAALREASHAGDQRNDELATAISAIRQEIRETQDNINVLRETSVACGQQVDETAKTLGTLQQELHGARQTSTDIEKTLRTQSAKYREQLDAHTRDLAALTERSRKHTQEMNQHIDTLTSLHKQEQSQRETALATLTRLNERVGAFEQQLSEERTRSAEALRTDRERLAALEKWLDAQATQFAKFDPVLRELHHQIVTLHERLETLENLEIAQVLDDHGQRLAESEQQLQAQAYTLEEMRPTLEKLALQLPAAARLNRMLMGGLIGVGILLVALLAFIATR
ncbi:MAG: hypothetical protein KDI50_00400, partial [Candidatus Competibacteraceae bacterium]|nr:hypothetical protein [Candidatus Competibacteraceae bacterium]